MDTFEHKLNPSGRVSLSTEYLHPQGYSHHGLWSFLERLIHSILTAEMLRQASIISSFIQGKEDFSNFFVIHC